MKFLEVAPHNYGRQGKYDRVAGCLIAKCCRLAYTEPKDPIWKGWLTFTPVNEKVAAVYKTQYGAMGVPKLMTIGRDKANELIEEYL